MPVITASSSCEREKRPSRLARVRARVRVRVYVRVTVWPNAVGSVTGRVGEPFLERRAAARKGGCKANAPCPDSESSQPALQLRALRVRAGSFGHAGAPAVGEQYLHAV